MSDTIELAKWHDPSELPESAAGRLFGELVKLAAPIVEHYVSDLYHDASWLRRNLRQDYPDQWHKFEFYYAMDAWGTAIGTEPKFVFAHREDAQYKITVENVDNVWQATFERIK